MKRENKIMISGAFYGTNFGDHLFAIMLAERVGPKAVLKNASRGIVESIGVPSVSTRAIPLMKGVVFGPGGYFGERPGEPFVKKIFRVRHHYGPAILARLSRTPYCIVGVGVGPVSSPVTRSLLRFVIGGARIVTVRDQESVEYLRKICKFVTDDVESGPDAALIWSELNAVPVESEPQPWNSFGRVFLHVEPNPSAQLGALWDVIVDTVAEDPGASLVIGCDYVEAAPILDALQRRWAAAMGGRIETHVYEAPQDFVRFLRDVDGIVTHKLHVGIVGSALGKAVVSFPTHPKTARFYRQIDESARCVKATQLTAEEISAHVRRYLVQPVRLSARTRQEALVHAAAVAKFVNSI